ncbi:MAG: HIT family protein [Candidatus Buchananbacteria bacterium]|nr:HIT family protein [Candidatus Buchananbacteria bacterium]
MPKKQLPTPPKKAIIYEDDKLYACLASRPITVGHVVVVWKKDVNDIHLLNDRDYSYLMAAVDILRDAMLKALKVKKIYLIYMDEVNHVHWHLVPRYNEKGYDVFSHKPAVLKNFSLTAKIKKAIILK